MAKCVRCGMPQSDNSEICPACGKRKDLNAKKSVYDIIFEMEQEDNFEGFDKFDAFDGCNEQDCCDTIEDRKTPNDFDKPEEDINPTNNIYNAHNATKDKNENKQKSKQKKSIIAIFALILVGVFAVAGLINLFCSRSDDHYDPNGTSMVLFGDLENLGWNVQIPEGAFEDMEDITVEGWKSSENNFATVKLSSNFETAPRADENMIIRLWMGENFDTNDIDFYVVECSNENETITFIPRLKFEDDGGYFEFETCTVAKFFVKNLSYEEYILKFSHLAIDDLISESAPLTDILGYSFWELFEGSLWADSEIETAYRAYINKKSCGYADIETWDDLEKQMRGTRRALCVGAYENYAALTNRSVEDVAKDDELCSMLEDGMMQNLKILFEHRYQNRSQEEALLQEYKTVVEKFDDNDLLTRGIYGFDFSTTLEERIDQLFDARKNVAERLGEKVETLGLTAEQREYWIAFYIKLWVFQPDE